MSNKNCPNCRKDAYKEDIRIIFINSTDLKDTTNLEIIEKNLRVESKKRKELELELLEKNEIIESLRKKLKESSEDPVIIKIQNDTEKSQNNSVVIDLTDL
jgi:excinuclease UvrABC ATPase subunit